MYQLLKKSPHSALKHFFKEYWYLYTSGGKSSSVSNTPTPEEAIYFYPKNKPAIFLDEEFIETPDTVIIRQQTKREVRRLHLQNAPAAAAACLAEKSVLFGGHSTVRITKFKHALRHNLPVIIVSFYTDQPTWGKIVEHRKLGVHVPVKSLTQKNFFQLFALHIQTKSKTTL